MAFPTTGVIDTFNRANESPVGTPWVNSIIASDGAMAISGNEMISLGGWCSAYYGAAMYGPDSEVFITLRGAIGAANGWEFAVRIINGDTAVADFYMCHWPGNVGSVQFYKSIGGTQTQVGSNMTNPGPVAGDSLGFSVIGDTLEAWRKPSAGSWTSVGSATDSALAGKVGNIGMLWNDSASFDDFGGGTVVVPQVITPQYKNFPKHKMRS